MSRPTEERKDKTVKLRISEELYDEIVQRGENLSETIREILKEGVREKTESFVPQEINESLRDIKTMAKLLNVSTEELTKQFCEMLNEGALTVERGVLKATKEGWVEEIEDVCHDCGISVSEAMKNIVKALRRGTL